MAEEDDDDSCPLCLEKFDLTDFQPCTCGYKICVFCWNKLNEQNEIPSKTISQCPNCRSAYAPDKCIFTPQDPEELKAEREKRHKEKNEKRKTANCRRHLGDLRVVQRNLVYVVGLTPNVAKEEQLKQHHFFGQYGRILKVIVNKANLNSSKPGPSTVSAYVTYQHPDEAKITIKCVDGAWLDGKLLRAYFGTTKYCSFFLRNMACAKPGCTYLHEFADEADHCTKDQMIHQQQTSIRPRTKPPPKGRLGLPPPTPQNLAVPDPLPAPLLAKLKEEEVSKTGEKAEIKVGKDEQAAVPVASLEAKESPQRIPRSNNTEASTIQTSSPVSWNNKQKEKEEKPKKEESRNEKTSKWERDQDNDRASKKNPLVPKSEGKDNIEIETEDTKKSKNTILKKDDSTEQMVFLQTERAQQNQNNKKQKKEKDEVTVKKEAPVILEKEKDWDKDKENIESKPTKDKKRTKPKQEVQSSSQKESSDLEKRIDDKVPQDDSACTTQNTPEITPPEVIPKTPTPSTNASSTTPNVKAVNNNTSPNQVWRSSISWAYNTTTCQWSDTNAPPMENPDAWATFSSVATTQEPKIMECSPICLPSITSSPMLTPSSPPTTSNRSPTLQSSTLTPPSQKIPTITQIKTQEDILAEVIPLDLTLSDNAPEPSPSVARIESVEDLLSPPQQRHIEPPIISIDSDFNEMDTPSSNRRTRSRFNFAQIEEGISDNPSWAVPNSNPGNDMTLGNNMNTPKTATNRASPEIQAQVKAAIANAAQASSPNKGYSSSGPRGFPHSISPVNTSLLPKQQPFTSDPHNTAPTSPPVPQQIVALPLGLTPGTTMAPVAKPNMTLSPHYYSEVVSEGYPNVYEPDFWYYTEGDGGFYYVDRTHHHHHHHHHHIQPTIPVHPFHPQQLAHHHHHQHAHILPQHLHPHIAYSPIAALPLKIAKPGAPPKQQGKAPSNMSPQPQSPLSPQPPPMSTTPPPNSPTTPITVQAGPQMPRGLQRTDIPQMAYYVPAFQTNGTFRGVYRR